MHYDEANDRIVSSDDEQLKIYPVDMSFIGAIDIEINIDDQAIELPVDRIDELIKGLRTVKALVSGTYNQEQNADMSGGDTVKEFFSQALEKMAADVSDSVSFDMAFDEGELEFELRLKSINGDCF